MKDGFKRAATKLFFLTILSVMIMLSAKISVELPGANEYVIQFFEAVVLIWALLYSIARQDSGKNFFSFLIAMLITASIILAAKLCMYVFAATVGILAIFAIIISLIFSSG